MYLLAVLFPPIAVLFTGTRPQAFKNFLLCFLFFVPGVIHAIIIVSDKKENTFNKKQIKKLKNRGVYLE